MGLPPVTDNQLSLYKKLLKDSEASRRAEVHWTNVLIMLVVIFGSAFFILLLLWASKMI